MAGLNKELYRKDLPDVDPPMVMPIVNGGILVVAPASNSEFKSRARESGTVPWVSIGVNSVRPRDGAPPRRVVSGHRTGVMVLSE